MESVRYLLGVGLTPNRVAQKIASAATGGVGLIPRLTATALAGTYTRAAIEGVAERYSAAELKKALVYFHCLRNDWGAMKERSQWSDKQKRAVDRWLIAMIDYYADLHRTASTPNLL